MVRLIAILVMIWLFATTQAAHAYLDPGNGSMLLQVFLGGAAGLAVFLKYYWGQLTGIFQSKRPTQADEES